MARKLGVRTRLDVHGAYVPSIGLGSIAVSPLDMASAYATLAAGGIRSKPMAITKVIFPNGKRDTSADWGKPRRTRVISQGVAYEVTQILQQNVLYGTGVGANFGRPAAGKTGTTDEHVDAWFCGYTPQLEATVWVGLPESRDPDGERARDRGRGRHLPGDDLEPVHVAGSSRSSRTRDFAVPDAAADLHLLARRVAVDRRLHADATPRRATRRRTPIRSAALAAGAAVLALTAAAVMLAWPSGSPLVPRNGGHPGGDSVYAWWFLGLLAAAFAVYVARGRARAQVGAARRSRRRARLRRPARPARRAVAALDRRLGVLGLRPARGRARRQSVRGRAERVPRRSGLPRGSATAGATRRRSTVPRSRSRPSRSRSRPGRRPDAAAWIYKTIAALAVLGSGVAGGPAARRGRRSRSRSSAGTRCSRCTSPAAVTTTRGSRSSSSARSRRPPRAGGASRASAGRSATSSSGFRSCFCRCARSRRGRPAGGSATSASQRPRSPSRRSRLRRYGSGWLDAFGSLARNANHETSWALPHRLEQAGAPALAHDRGLRGSRSPRLCVAACARRGADAPASGWPRALLLLAAPYLVVWYVVWAVPLAAAEDDEPAALLVARALRVPAAPDDPALSVYGGRTRSKTSTPSCSKTTRHAGLRRSHATCVDRRQRRRRRRRIPGCVSSTATHFASSMNGKLRNAPPRREMRAQRVRCADDGVGGISLQRARRDAVVLGDDGGAAAASLRPGSSRHNGIAPEPVVRRSAQQRARSPRREPPARLRTRAAPKTAAATSGGDRGRVVEVDRGLRRRRREEVERELGQRGQRDRREQRTARRAAGRGRAGSATPPWSNDERRQQRGRIADGEPPPRRTVRRTPCSPPREMRDDDLDREHRPRDARDCDRARRPARLPCASAYQMPSAATTSGMSSFGSAGEHREDRERQRAGPRRGTRTPRAARASQARRDGTRSSASHVVAG